jgi:hypothetical protein
MLASPSGQGLQAVGGEMFRKKINSENRELGSTHMDEE